MKISSFYFVITFCLIFWNSCSKNKTYYYEPCKEINFSDEPTSGFQYILDGSFNWNASFNPNNSNQIVYHDEKQWKIYTYDLETREKNTLYGGPLIPSFASKWGANDWILLSLLDGNIYKIKSNGDSLTQLTFSKASFSPEWNITADKFIYNTGGIVVPALTVICDDNGVPLDTLPGSLQGSWQHDSLMVLREDNEIFIFNPETNYRELINGISHDFGGSAVQWIDDKHFVAAGSSGVFRINYKTHESHLIAPVCAARVYWIGGYSRETQKLIFTKREQELLDWNTLKQRFTIVTMNTDGTGEEEIIIPE